MSNLAGLVGWPWFYWHLKSRGRGESFRPRLGLQLPAGPPPGYPRIWLHGVSVGEILAAVPLARELKKLLPQSALIVTTGTETGQTLARKHFTPLGALVCYFPLDIPWAVRRYLERLRPQLAITLESEIWPNFLELAHQRRVLLVLANARISDQSFRRYLRYSWYTNNIISNYDLIAAGTSQDYRRLLELGLDPAKLHLTGNLKCDRLLQDRDEARAQEFQRLLQGGLDGSPERAPVLLAASTHPGEEEVVLAAYQELRGPYPALLLVLAPRHPERAPALGELLAKSALPFHFWSRLKAGSESRRHPVVLVDTIGDLFEPLWRRGPGLCGRQPRSPWRPKPPGGRGLGFSALLRPQSAKLPLGSGHSGGGRGRDHGYRRRLPGRRGRQLASRAGAAPATGSQSPGGPDSAPGRGPPPGGVDRRTLASARRLRPAA